MGEYVEQLNFEKLFVYQKSLIFVDGVYKLSKHFPSDEKYGLTDQLKRASVSILANIAEGFGRFHEKDMTHFFRVSRSSAYECIALMQVAQRQDYLKEDDYKDMYSKAQEITRMISGYIKSINK